MKVRRIDFSPDEFIAGTLGMTNEQIGVYWLAISFIYSTGGPIPEDDVRLLQHSKAAPTTVRRILGELVAAAKLELHDGLISNRRAIEEIASGTARISQARAAGKLGGRPPTNSMGYDNRPLPSPLSDQKTQPETLARAALPLPLPLPPSPKERRTPLPPCDDQKQNEKTQEPMGSVDDRFPEVWAMWPRKERELAARAAWAESALHGGDDEIIAGVRRYLKALDDPVYCQSLAKFLEERRWTEFPPPFAGGGAGLSAPKLTAEELADAEAKAVERCRGILANGGDLVAWQLPYSTYAPLGLQGTARHSAGDLRAMFSSRGLPPPAWLVPDD